MKLLEELSQDSYTATADFHYDLFDGGYIKPEHFVSKEDAEKVREAMAIIQDFQDSIEECMEEM